MEVHHMPWRKCRVDGRNVVLDDVVDRPMAKTRRKFTGLPKPFDQLYDVIVPLKDLTRGEILSEIFRRAE